MSWEEQGRQQHGWFGHGTSGKADDGRYGRIVYGVIGNLPAAVRSRWDGMMSRGMAGRTTDVLRGLSDASGLDAAKFADLLPDSGYRDRRAGAGGSAGGGCGRDAGG